jgi:hypothetical protein
VELVRSELARLKVELGITEDRCEVCLWPLGDQSSCRPFGDCGYRPGDRHPDQERMRARWEALKPVQALRAFLAKFPEVKS